jgi:glycine/D-amino acid oxidase-like deaminating enzyme/nitrite reductase/ring-hydroxylating ferredoxin subunit
MGSLDERNPSLWVETTRDAQPPSTDLESLDDRYDVVVVGAGIAGLSTALTLAERGARVAVLEAGRVCSGVTAYTTAKVTSLHGLTYAGLLKHRGEGVARAYADANQAAVAQVASWVDGYGIDCDFSRRPAYTYTSDPGRAGDVEAEVDAARRLGLPVAFTTDTELPYAVRAAVRMEDQAQLHPRRYCLGLVAALTGLGGRVVEHARVTGVSAGSPCDVQVGDVTVRADHVVLATHLPILDRGLFFAKTHPTRSYAAAVRVKGDVPRGMYLSADSPTRSVRAAEGDSLVLLGGEGHKVGQDPDTRERYDALEQWARAEWQVDEVVHRWSAQDYVAADGIPYIGRQLPGSRVLVATGFGKWGMTNGTAAGAIIADLIGDQPNDQADAFQAFRVAGPLTSKAMYTENVDAVGGHLIGDRLKTLNPPDADTLEVGEGGIVRLDGDKVAAYRHEDGSLTAVSPVCRHVGCLVAFNTAEKTWDCPCHGSRYTLDGRVIQGPSVHDLATKTPAASEAP